MKEFKVGDAVSYESFWRDSLRRPLNGVIIAIHNGKAWIDNDELVLIENLKEPYTPTDKEAFIDKALGELHLNSDSSCILEKLFDAGCRFVEVWHGQLENIPTEGTWLLKRGEKVFDSSEVQTETEGL